MRGAEALEHLTAGNGRFVASPECPRKVGPGGPTGSHPPLAVVLTCADARIPVERVFDMGIGDLFVVRVAGNVAGVHQTGTIEYGVGVLRAPLLVVMGHTRCGAVTAVAQEAWVTSNVAALIEPIRASVRRAREDEPGAGLERTVALAVRHNVLVTIGALMSSSGLLREGVERGELVVAGAVYDVDSGEVEWIAPDRPHGAGRVV